MAGGFSNGFSNGFDIGGGAFVWTALPFWKSEVIYGMFKNTASQKITLLVIDTANGTPKTGDAANLTAYLKKDGGAVTALTDATAFEDDATNAPGQYSWDVSQSESNADWLEFTGKSSTSGIRVIPKTVYTFPTTGILAPTTAGRTLDVSAGGEAGVDWANVGSPTSTVGLSGTTVGALGTGGITAASFAAGAIDAAAIAANAIGASELAADAVAEIQSGLALAADLATLAGYVDTEVAAIKAKTDNLPSDPADQSAVEAAITAATSPLATAANLATVASYLDTEIAAILADTNELQTDWANGGRLDLILDAAGSAGDPWITALPGAYGAGTAGKLLGDLPTSVTAVKAKTDNLPTDPADQSAVEAAITAATSPLATAANLAIVAGYLDTEIAAIKAKTDNLPTDPADQSAVEAAITAATSPLATAANLAIVAGYIDTEIAAIKLITDRVSTMLVLDGAVYQYTANALELAPAGGGGGAGIDEDLLEQLVREAIYGSRAGVLDGSIAVSDVLDVVRTNDFSLDIPVAVAADSTLVWVIRRCPADSDASLEVDSDDGLITLVSVETPTAADGTVTRVDADTVAVWVRARSLAELPIGEYIGELREITTADETLGRYEVGLSVRDSAGRRVA